MIHSVLSLLLIIVMSFDEFSYATSNETCQCISKVELVNQLKASGIITRNITLPPKCNPFKVSDFSELSLKKTLDKNSVVDILVIGRDTYVAVRTGRSIYKFDEYGNETARYKLPRQPKYMTLHDNRLYVTTEALASGNAVMRSTDLHEGGGELNFTVFLELNYMPNGIAFTPDGKEFLIGSYQTKIRVYNTTSATLNLVRDIETTWKASRFIAFSANDTIYVTHATNNVSVYSKDYEHLRTLTFGTTAEKFQGLVLQCDGSKILVSENSKLCFIDQNDELSDIFTIPMIASTSLRDMAVTSEGSVFITDHHGDKIYVYY